MKIAILGYGVVGTGVDEILKMEDIGIECIKILDREDKKFIDRRITSNIDDITLDDSIDLVVETLGGIHPAYEYIKSALKAHKHVVSANKAVIAHYYQEFNELALQNNVGFLYEGAVGGAIPIIKIVHDTIKINDIYKVEGILNATSNLILDSMYNKNQGFIEALSCAQALGFAERDASSDTEGIDVKNKMMILSSIAFNQVSAIDNIVTYGINKITNEDITYFKQKKQVCKLFGCAITHNDTYSIEVLPVLFNQNKIEAQVALNNNIASIYTIRTGKLSIIGEGAGRLQTAHSIVGDMIDLKNNQNRYTFINTKKRKFMLNTELNNYIIRTNKQINCNDLARADSRDADYYYYNNHSLKDIITIYENILFLDNDALLVKIMKD